MNMKGLARVSLIFMAFTMLLCVTSYLIVPHARIVNNNNYIVGGEVISTQFPAVLESLRWVAVAGAVSTAIAIIARKRK
ncbi:MAG: hypothetical protein QXI32_03530 [Candidatus Bathyarchaeia archaeon]